MVIKSKDTVVQSIAKAEYIALWDTAWETIYIHQKIRDIEEKSETKGPAGSQYRQQGVINFDGKKNNQKVKYNDVIC